MTLKNRNRARHPRALSRILLALTRTFCTLSRISRTFPHLPRLLLALAILAIVPFSLNAQQTITLSDFVEESDGGEAIVNAIIRAGGKKTAFTNTYGHFTLTLPKGNHQTLTDALSLGLLAESATLEGPIIKEKASFSSPPASRGWTPWRGNVENF
ncbi:MAG: hypothetical protein LBI96_05175 [Odoribacteraceae bacterium]|nr:hypothetical protein [Odoribacteraceae bacterium]